MAVLPQSATDEYHREGYYIRREPLFPPADFDRLCAIFEEHLADRGERLGDELDTPHFHDERLLEFLMNDQVLDMVEELIGPDIGLWSSHFISKEPKTGRPTPWHTDAGYWKGRFDAFTGIVTIWLAIDRADEENGCMRVIPGTHRDADGEYIPIDAAANAFARELQGVDESRAVSFELDPNQCSLHDSRLVHGAKANTSDRRRTGYTMRYFSQEMKLNLDHPRSAGHKLWHCRGNNPHGNPVVNS
ncbi:MAG: phytanoyl-CoA dioxygenase family protein [Spirochaetota bacterium]